MTFRAVIIRNNNLQEGEVEVEDPVGTGLKEEMQTTRNGTDSSPEGIAIRRIVRRSENRSPGKSTKQP